MKPGRPRIRTAVPLVLRRGGVPWDRQRPTWRDAAPAVIARELKRAQARPSGNWYVVGASRALREDRPLACEVAGRELVVWRGPDGRPVAGPGACPHLGAPLSDSPVRCGTLVCHWHGLALNGTLFAGWNPLPVHDDGVLLWLRLDDIGGEAPLDRPALPPRPDPRRAVATVYTGSGVCDPEDIVANRLDPWHGAWLHPYSFVDLTVVGSPGDQEAPEDPEALEDPGNPEGRADPQDGGFTVDVSFKLAWRVVVPVRAVFTAPGPRTVVMRIVEGEGAGSVVETHATPLGDDERGRPRTAVTEAVLATSDRAGFTVALRAAPVLRPLMRAAAARLWRDDLAYAERRRHLRSTGRFPG
ncbi:DUF5914 domain-containing protein [Streptomyces sp. NPDC005573]|uniref:DUF5914 domain-containing protein n=1 Tax=Streptomyces sp. NPDC005573 TaxID=3156890 RepID=UPI0033A8C9A1